MQQKFEKIRDLLVREKWDELTADERQMLEEWRQEEESHEQLYRRLAEPGALRRHFDELAAVDTERALAYNRKLLQRYALRRVVRWSLPYAAVVAIVAGVWLLFPRTESQPRVTETIEKSNRESDVPSWCWQTVRLWNSCRICRKHWKANRKRSSLPAIR